MGACVNVLWHSNAPWAATGYGVQTRLFTPRIRDLGHNVALSAFYGLEGASIQWQGMTVYPKAFHPYGMDVIGQHAAEHKADVVITLVDGWVLQGHKITATGAKWAPLFPVDHDPLPAPVAKAVGDAWQPLTYSRHGQAAAQAAGIDSIYVPHGVDCQQYRPIETDAARTKLGIDPDAFVVGIVAANKGTPSRKALPTQLEAFGRLHEAHPDAILYLHTRLGPEMEGLNLPALIEGLGIPESAVKVCDQYRNLMGYADEVMAHIYSAMDVLASATMGEGFGVPIIEAQACGTPVIVGGWTAMPELVGAGWTVDAHERIYTPMGAYQYIPTVDGVYEALEAAYSARGDKQLATDARAMAEKYDADHVTEAYWRPALERMHQRLFSGEAEAPPVEVVAA